MSATWFERPALTGQYVRLEALSAEHAHGLFAAGADPAVWSWLGFRQPADVEDMRAQLTYAIKQYEARERVPWVQLDQQTGEVAGTTSYHDVSPSDRGLCIGYTWVGTPWQRTGLNLEAKLLLMERAFEELGAIRVGWHTHHRNLRAQRAIEGLGAQREGVLRNHRRHPDGSVRDTVVYSVTGEEWPGVRARLRARLKR